MKKLITSAFLAGFVTASASAAVIEVTSDITSDTTWTSANDYVLTDIIYVKNGATLTINPGTIIRGEPEDGALPHPLGLQHAHKRPDRRVHVGGHRAERMTAGGGIRADGRRHVVAGARLVGGGVGREAHLDHGARMERARERVLWLMRGEHPAVARVGKVALAGGQCGVGLRQTACMGEGGREGTSLLSTQRCIPEESGWSVGGRGGGAGSGCRQQQSEVR